ncbi:MULTISPECIES: hypothetical protein [unclassified Sphingobacterium]|uniref:hypothetical protein n=1 Tax=unclassified Sphingobacterium TaxID=2609468 RepID=UPI00104948A8|nr:MULTISPECIES: hypothetical protein [unclassified Sphingobacterium]MCS3553469.1 hypothetical protein [Sphingobacterium sp. JUb21]TCR09321.1 hypothetical protein EDF66_102114 [Sphingobacterium sp. JUb20]
MKIFKNNRISNCTLLPLLTCCILTTTSSCNKDNSQAEQKTPNGQSQITVRVASINEGNLSIINGTKSTSPKPTIPQKHTINIVEGDGFDAVIAIDNNSPTTTQTGIKAANNTRAATSPMETGTLYRLFLYKKNNGTYNYSKSVELTTGTESPIQLNNGTYKWVAVSYNSKTDQVQERGPDNNFSLPENKDVLYATSSTDLIVTGATTPIAINFNRTFARVAIEINTLGLFSPMTSTPTISVTGDQILKTGTIDLITGEFIGSLTTGTDLALTKNDFTDINPVSGQAYQKVAYFYTAGQPAKSLTITLSDLITKLDDGTTRNFFLSTLTQTKTITPERGKNHRFLVGIAESALTLGTTKWARSNLFYRTSDALGATTPYRFYANNPYLPNQQESFFSFKGHLPGRLASANPANQKDPCALVYPAGLWKTPSEAQITPLTSNRGLLDGALGSVLDLLGTLPATPGSNYGTIYIEYPITAGFNPAYGGTTSRTNRVRFYYNGVQNNVILANGLINMSIIEAGATAGIWTSDRVLDGGLLDQLSTGVGAWGYLGSTKSMSLFQPQRGIATKSAGLLNIDLLGLGLVASGFMNVRCVRDDSWTTVSTLPNYNPYPIL